MKPIKLLFMGLATIGLALVTSAQSFGSLGEHKDPQKVEVFQIDSAALITLDQPFALGVENVLLHQVEAAVLSQFPAALEGFSPNLDVYRSDHYQVRNLTRLKSSSVTRPYHISPHLVKRC